MLGQMQELSSIATEAGQFQVFRANQMDNFFEACQKTGFRAY